MTPHLELEDATRNFGLFNPNRDAGKPENSVGVGLMWLSFVVGGLTITGLTFLELGIGAAIQGAVLAIIPAGLYLALFLWLDRYDPEPPGRLTFAFVSGAFIALPIAYIVNTVVLYLFGGMYSAIISAPIIEEGAKAGCVLIIAKFYRKDFDSIVDGIVYAGVVALGFATVENIGYYGRSLSQEGEGVVIRTWINRGILSPYAHVLFTCMTGLGIGVARETHDKALKIAAPIIGFIMAVSFHALWNSLAILELWYTAYLLILVPMFFALLALIFYLVRREGRILKQSLAVEVNRGLITQRQLDTAISVFRRTGWVASAIGDGRLFGARRRFLRSVAKLGFCHWHARRAAEAGAENVNLPLITQFQGEVSTLRDIVG